MLFSPKRGGNRENEHVPHPNSGIARRPVDRWKHANLHSVNFECHSRFHFTIHTEIAVCC